LHIAGSTFRPVSFPPRISSGKELAMSRARVRPHLEVLESRTVPTIVVRPVLTPTTTVPEAEEEIAAFPGNPDQLVAVISDYSQGPSIGRLTKYAYSTDAGNSWQEGFVPTSGGEVVTGDGQTWENNFDPSVAIDNQGRVYLLNGDKHYTGSNANGIYLSIGTVGSQGLQFTAADVLPVYADLSPNTSLKEDKPWIAVDTSQSIFQGSVYATWTHFFPTPAGPESVIYFSRSADGGETWSAPIDISSIGINTQVRGSQVAVGPDGSVYVVYATQIGGGAPSADYQMLAKSVDGGQTFSGPHDISGRFIPVDFAMPIYRTNSLPAIAVSPSGTVEVVYPQWDADSAAYEVGIIQSTDGGQTFSAYHVLNDSTAGIEFFASVAVDASNGLIWVSWLDTRNSPSNPRYYDLYAVASRDGGQTFSANVRVTPQSDFAEIVGVTGSLGDYTGIVAAGGKVHPVWTSGGAGEQGGNGQLQTATLIDRGGNGGAKRDAMAVWLSRPAPQEPGQAGAGSPSERSHPFTASTDRNALVGPFIGGASGAQGWRLTAMSGPLTAPGRRSWPDSFLASGQAETDAYFVQVEVPW
jgi:hypothetical protein